MYPHPLPRSATRWTMHSVQDLSLPSILWRKLCQKFTRRGSRLLLRSRVIRKCQPIKNLITSTVIRTALQRSWHLLVSHQLSGGWGFTRPRVCGCSDGVCGEINLHDETFTLNGTELGGGEEQYISERLVAALASGRTIIYHNLGYVTDIVGPDNVGQWRETLITNTTITMLGMNDRVGNGYSEEKTRSTRLDIY